VVTRRVATAAGVFAPGHVGELTRFLPFELVDAVLVETGAVERRLRDLPSRVGVYFVLALGLFPDLGYQRVWDKLVAGWGGGAPSAKALRDLRRRVGVAPVRELFGVVAGPLAQPGTPGARFGRWRTVSFDGCTSIKAPDTARNVAWLRKATAKRGVTGYPMVQLMTLVETGTRALIGAVFGPIAGEAARAKQLLGLLTGDMLVLADRGFDDTDLMEKIDGTGAVFLIRLNSSRRPQPLLDLHDGTHLARVGGLIVRIITAQVTVTCDDGTSWTGRYRWATTLTHPRRHRATALIRLYHERWEHEVTYLALRHTLLHGRVLRSGDPIGLEQEIWALLTTYQLLRTAIVNAVEQADGVNPDRAGFTIALTIALTTAQNLLTKAENIIDDLDPIGQIGRAVLADLAPPRRLRVSTRKVKSALSRYNKADPDRPARATTVTAIDINLTDRPDLTAASGP
jgi:Insertion element 4 transposase N-terminal/Transposase DDE domain